MFGLPELSPVRLVMIGLSEFVAFRLAGLLLLKLVMLGVEELFDLVMVGLVGFAVVGARLVLRQLRTFCHSQLISSSVGVRSSRKLSPPTPDPPTNDRAASVCPAAPDWRPDCTGVAADWPGCGDLTADWLVKSEWAWLLERLEF